MNHIRKLGAAAFAAGLVATAAPAPAAGQSLFATRGLGVPAPAVDARAAALGGIGVGLIGFHTSAINPAEIAGITRRGVSAALQPVSINTEVDGEEAGTAGTRFPLLRLLYPIGQRTILSASYGSYLEQSWAITSETELSFENGTVTATDVLRSTGGMAQLRLGFAYTLTPSLAVGAAGGLITGNVEQVIARSFGADTLNLLIPFEERTRWNYLAPMASVGVRWDVGDRLRIGASAMVAAEVEASVADDEDDSRERTLGAPLELAAGASVRLSPLFLVNGGTIWSRVPAPTGEAVSRETLRIGGGLEYQGVRSGVRTYPVRVGARWAQLPYYNEGETAPTEWAAGLGFGFRLGDPANPAAVADLGVERGGRSGLDAPTRPGGVSESLWRFTFSLSLFGN
jgi:hypothetical protein